VSLALPRKPSIYDAFGSMYFGEMGAAVAGMQAPSPLVQSERAVDPKVLLQTPSYQLEALRNAQQLLGLSTKSRRIRHVAIHQYL
jgi:hypothetical protein